MLAFAESPFAVGLLRREILIQQVTGNIERVIAIRRCLILLSLEVARKLGARSCKI